MNLLDPVLRISSSSAVLATLQAFLSLADTTGSTTQEIQEIKEEVVSRSKAPLITLVASGSSEAEYFIWKHVEALVYLCPVEFDDEYRQFYIRFKERTHVKYLKVQILPLLAIQYCVTVLQIYRLYQRYLSVSRLSVYRQKAQVNLIHNNRTDEGDSFLALIQWFDSNTSGLLVLATTPGICRVLFQVIASQNQQSKEESCARNFNNLFRW
jgi:hypothetical protein